MRNIYMSQYPREGLTVRVKHTRKAEVKRKREVRGNEHWSWAHAALAPEKFRVLRS